MGEWDGDPFVFFGIFFSVDTGWILLGCYFVTLPSQRAKKAVKKAEAKAKKTAPASATDVSPAAAVSVTKAVPRPVAPSSFGWSGD